MSTGVADIARGRHQSVDRARISSWSSSPDGRSRYPAESRGLDGEARVSFDQRPGERRRSSSAQRRGRQPEKEPRSQSHMTSRDENLRRLRIRERAYDVNLATTDTIPYDPLLDSGLADFFSAPNVRMHLVRQGIIKPTGEVVDPKEFKRHQIETDAHEREGVVRRRQEEAALNREVEVALRRYFATSPKKQKFLSGDKPAVVEYAACTERLRTTAMVYSNPNPLLENVRRLLRECEKKATRRARARQRKSKATRASANMQGHVTEESSAHRKPRAPTALPRKTQSDERAEPGYRVMRSQSAGLSSSGSRCARRPGSSRARRSCSKANYSPVAVRTHLAQPLVNESVATDSSDIAIHQAYRPHTAPVHRGQVVVQGDWSDSEFGTPSGSRSTSRPTSAQLMAPDIMFEENPETTSLKDLEKAVTKSETTRKEIPPITGSEAEIVRV